MKVCSNVLFAVLVAFSCAESEKKKLVLKEMFIKCAEELQVDMEIIKSNKDKADPDREVKCVYACVSERAGVMNADGTANQTGVDALIAKLPEEMDNLKENIYECTKSMKAGLAKCESGWLVAKCVKDKTPHSVCKKDREGSGEEE